MFNQLSEREKIILRYIIEDYIQTATPVGSRYISKKKDVKLSPATIRNVMSDLEDLSFLTHPHTSGGRVPTDKGYRYFVNELMEVEPLKQGEKKKIMKQIEETDSSSDIFNEVSKILGKLTHEISIVSQPYFSEGILEKLEIISLSSTKILIVVSIRSGLVRTLMFDIESEIKRDKLEKIAALLTEKLGGHTLKEIRKTFKDRIGNIESGTSSIVKIFIDSINKIFQDEKEGVTLYIGGTAEILSQPEFGQASTYKNIIELANDRNVVFHVLNNLDSDENGFSISIGLENKEEKLKNYSVLSTEYHIGDVSGKIALIGPKRMDYSKLVSLLDFTSEVINERI